MPLRAAMKRVGASLRALGTHEFFPRFSARVRKAVYHPLGVRSPWTTSAARCPRRSSSSPRRTRSSTTAPTPWLQVRSYIRAFRISPDAARAAEEFREEIEELRDALLAGKADEAREQLAAFERNYQACRDAFTKPGG